MANATLGNQLRKYRKLNNMSQEQVARRLNMKRQTYSNYECSKRTPDPNTLNAIAELFHVKIDRLLHSDTARDDSSCEYLHEGILSSSDSHLLLTGTEAKLVMDYRSLPDKHQEELLHYMKFLKSESASSTS